MNVSNNVIYYNCDYIEICHLLKIVSVLVLTTCMCLSFRQQQHKINERLRLKVILKILTNDTCDPTTHINKKLRLNVILKILTNDTCDPTCAVSGIETDTTPLTIVIMSFTQNCIGVGVNYVYVFRFYYFK